LNDNKVIFLKSSFMIQFRKLIETTVANCSEAMETRDHFKNGAQLKSHTNRVNLVIFVCLLFFCIFSTYAQETKPSIAVVDLKYDASHEWSKTSFLTNALVNTEKYTVMESSRVKQIVEELGLQSTQYASDHASEIGNLLGVQKVITGKLFYTNRKNRYMGRTLSVNLIDIESGAIEATATVEDKIRIRRNGRFFESNASTLELSQRALSELFN